MSYFLKIFFLLSLCIQHICVQAQLDYVPPSPNASGIVKHGNIAVGHYTGVPNISIPFGALGGKGVSLPVSLDYHASGIKVQDVAGPAGLGFTLQAGGAITRMVRGIPDGLKANCQNETTASYWSNINENCDGERDIFYFSFMGRSGKMFLDDEGQPQTMPYQDIKIEPGVGPLSIGHWRITDENGYVYIFGLSPSESEQTTYYTGSTTFTEKYTYTSTWYLSKVVSPTGNISASGVVTPLAEQVATFMYTQGSDIEYIMYSQKGRIPSGSSIVSQSFPNTKIKVLQPKYISNISTSLGSITISYLKDRLDLTNGWYLNTITYKDINNSEKRKYHFIFDYFVGQYNLPNQRLRLATIKEGLENPVAMNSFSYYELTYNGNSANPLRNDYKYDHYGYYNNSNNSCNPVYNLPLGCSGYQAITRLPGGSEALVFTLKEMTNANGGRTLFEFQNSGRGLRIQAISNFNQSSLVSKSSFTYEGATQFSEPIYSYTTYDNSTIYASNSLKDLYDLRGTNVGYSKVTETFIDGSKVVREFTNLSDFPEFSASVGKYLSDPPLGGAPQFQSHENVNGPPFAPNDTRFWMHGLPRFFKIYDSNNNLLRQDEMFYEEGGMLSSVENVALHSYQQTGGSNPKITYLSGHYYLHSKAVYLKWKTTTLYDQTDFSHALFETTNYSYHTTHKTFPRWITTTVGLNNPEQKITFRYPSDIIGSSSQPASPDELAGGIWGLKAKHIITPVEKLNYLKDYGSPGFQIIGGQLVTFKKGSPNGQPVPKGIYTLDLASPIDNLSTEATLTSNGVVFNYDNSRYRLMKSFIHNEPLNILTSSTDYNGITTSYEYNGYGNSLLTASSLLVGGTSKYRTQYSYNTINGVESIIDVNNVGTNYSYDNFGRLKLVKDNSQNKNILRRYRYNLGGVNEFTAEYNVGSKFSGTPIPFTAINNGETSGVTKYVWDFGDGQVLETTSSSVSHTYPSTGTYLTKLSKVNPEYGSVLTSKSISVVTPIVVSLTSPGTINLCQSGSINLSITATGGCAGAKTYSWTVTHPDGSISIIGPGSSVTFSTSGIIGSYVFKCTVTDACGNDYIATSSVYAYKQGGC